MDSTMQLVIIENFKILTSLVNKARGMMNSLIRSEEYVKIIEGALEASENKIREATENLSATSKEEEIEALKQLISSEEKVLESIEKEIKSVLVQTKATCINFREEMHDFLFFKKSSVYQISLNNDMEATTLVMCLIDSVYEKIEQMEKLSSEHPILSKLFPA